VERPVFCMCGLLKERQFVSDLVRLPFRTPFGLPDTDKSGPVLRDQATRLATRFTSSSVTAFDLSLRVAIIVDGQGRSFCIFPTRDTAIGLVAIKAQRVGT